MLSKNERGIFRLAKKSKENKIEYSAVQESLGLSYDDVQTSCRSLIDKGLASEKRYSPSPGAWIPLGIVLSEKGRHRIRYALEAFSSFFVKSVLVPILVSILTTLLTIWLSGHIK